MALPMPFAAPVTIAYLIVYPPVPHVHNTRPARCPGFV